MTVVVEVIVDRGMDGAELLQGLDVSEPGRRALAGRTLAETYDAGRPVDMMDKPDDLPTSPPAQQPRQDVINRVLAA